MDLHVRSVLYQPRRSTSTPSAPAHWRKTAERGNISYRMRGHVRRSCWSVGGPLGVGSVRQIVDASGNVTLAKSYEPYGSVLTSTGAASSIFAYAGEQIDTTGLIYLRARYMNPRLGLFLAHDPWSGDILRPGSMNGFGYVEGDPINATDPSGLRPRGAIPIGLTLSPNTVSADEYYQILTWACKDEASTAPLFLSLRIYFGSEANTDGTFGASEQLDFGRATRPGALFVAKVLIPSSVRGQLQFVQEIKPDRSVDAIEGFEGEQIHHEYHPKNQWALDSATGDPDIPYQFAQIAGSKIEGKSEYIFPNIQNSPLYAFTLGTFTTWDSPGTNIPVEKIRMEVHDEFRLFLIWRPTNGPQTSLALATWGWAATATKNRGRWSVKESPPHAEMGRPTREVPIRSPLFAKDFQWSPPFKR